MMRKFKKLSCKIQIVFILTGLPLSSPLSPFFSSTPDSHQAKQGEKVLLGCRVHNLGDSTLIWKKDGRMISAGDRIIRKDARMKLFGQSLEISDVTQKDAGDYICNVETFGSPLDQVHTLSILVPPSIQSEPRDGRYAVSAGSSVTMQCSASGNPAPQVTWTRQNNLLQNGEKTLSGHSLYLEDVKVQDGGVYLCTAENGVGKGATEHIQLTVLCKPAVQLSLNWVKTDKDIMAEISCHVHAEPLATVRWYKDTMLLEQTDKRRMETFTNKHILLLTKMELTDFGNYSCVGENSLGKEKQSVEVSGRPHSATILSPVVSMYKDKYILEWMVDSLLELEECRILYREESKETDGLLNWTNIIPTMNTKQLKDNRHTFTFHDLSPESEYEVIIQTRNKEGWADPSHIFKFRTKTKDSNLSAAQSSHAIFFSSHSRQGLAGSWAMLTVGIVMVVGGR